MWENFKKCGACQLWRRGIGLPFTIKWEINMYGIIKKEYQVFISAYIHRPTCCILIFRTSTHISDQYCAKLNYILPKIVWNIKSIYNRLMNDKYINRLHRIKHKQKWSLVVAPAGKWCRRQRTDRAWRWTLLSLLFSITATLFFKVATGHH